MWDGILPLSVPLAASPIVLQGRAADGRAAADGVVPLPEECFVAMNRFAVRDGAAEAFERRWAERDSSIQVPSRARRRANLPRRRRYKSAPAARRSVFITDLLYEPAPAPLYVEQRALLRRRA